jgi:TPR repeat protein
MDIDDGSARGGADVVFDRTGMLLRQCGCGTPRRRCGRVRARRLRHRKATLHAVAEQGIAHAQYSLGFTYATGQGVAQDFPAAITWYRRAADQGDASAQNNLAVLYAEGQGVAKDYGVPKALEAVLWFRKAAAQGNAAAQYDLGVMHSTGQGVARDDAQAIQWHRKAAEQGSTEAQFSLGFIYPNGRGFPRDDAEAVRWYRQAADRGDANAQTSLGFIYADGRGVGRDFAEAANWYRKAADRGRRRPVQPGGRLRQRARRDPDLIRAYKWYDVASTRFPAWAADNRAQALRSRDLIASKMTAPQVAEAQKLAKEWAAR